MRRPVSRKWGTTNTVVEEEDDKEETETKEDGKPNRDHLLQMIYMTNTVNGHANSPEEPAAKAEGCWDGDTLANLGFTNI